MPPICLYCAYCHYTGAHYECAYPMGKNNILYEELGIDENDRPILKYITGGKKIELNDRCSKWSYGGGWNDN